ncbi:hypothetical protein, partial [Thiolapillus sp.]
MFSLWRKARRENSAASRLLGTTSLRFALHGWQRLHPCLSPRSRWLVAPVRLKKWEQWRNVRHRHRSKIHVSPLPKR